jgi:2,4-dienoyl-CoA reductase-like NADH-dependent reductase (Old Yellow Enzyme family)
MAYNSIFSPLQLRSLTIKNRILRSNVAGRFDQYDGTGAQPRINWEVKFARGGVGAIISSFVPVHPRGRILPNYATIVSDDRIPFWRELGRKVHEHDCKYILQLSHGGRQRDIPTIDYPIGLSSTNKMDPLHGFECERMTLAQINETVQAFAEGARRARDAGLDGVELHGANGYLITQFLSSAINDREDEYGGVLANRARFVREIVQAIRKRVGRDFHLQMKISATEYNNALLEREPPGNTVDDSIQVCQWLKEDGVDAIHVSSGSSFPHPKNPAGDLPIEELKKTYDSLISSGVLALRNSLLFRLRLTGDLFKRNWEEARGPKEEIEGLNLPDARAIKKAVGALPVFCTGGFQTAAIIENAIARGDCDAVTIARPLIANNDLVQQFARGIGRPANPCTYCNKCLVNAPENPLGCYEESRFPSREAMVQEILSVYEPQPFHS